MNQVYKALDLSAFSEAAMNGPFEKIFLSDLDATKIVVPAACVLSAPASPTPSAKV
jgi:hypothetical protein